MTIHSCIHEWCVLPVFIWAPEEEAPWEPGAASRWWLYQSLESLSEKLQKVGCPLVIRRGPTLKALQRIAREVHATDVVWNRRYEPLVTKWDARCDRQLYRLICYIHFSSTSWKSKS